MISVIIGVTNVIPFFGPFIGAIPSALLLLLVSPKQCIWFLVMILVIQQFDGNILGLKMSIRDRCETFTKQQINEKIKESLSVSLKTEPSDNGKPEK